MFRKETLNNYLLEQSGGVLGRAMAPLDSQQDRSTGSLELTILMPCLNEAETLAACVDQALTYLHERGIAGEVLIADNGSTDGSPDIAIAHGARVIKVTERGYGAALLGGIYAARGRYVVMGDADRSYDFSALDPFVEKLRSGHELVMGNRFKGGIRPGAMPALHRYLGNPVLSTIGRVFFNAPIGDFHCGLRGFNRESILGLQLNTTGMEFASEMVVKANLHGLRVAEVPTTLSPDGRGRPPHLRSWRDGWRHLRFLMMFCPRWLFFYPGAALMMAGMAVMHWLLPGPRQIAGVTLDVNTLAFSSVAIICGFQALFFAVFAKVYAINARLLPADPRITVFTKFLRLEVGIVIGGLLLLGGLVLTVAAVSQWGQGSFGPLDPSVSMRLVMPAVTAVVMGTLIVFSSFFLSVLGLQHR